MAGSCWAVARWFVRKRGQRDELALADQPGAAGGRGGRSGGGPDRGAAEFGPRRPNRLAGIRRGWTPEAIEQELKQLIGSRDTWPSRGEFYAAGLASMLTSIYVHEGRDHWVSRMGVKLKRDAAGRRDRLWTEQHIEEELKRFCAGHEAWPTEREFIEAGQRALYAAASRNGGIARWADALGLARGRRHS